MGNPLINDKKIISEGINPVTGLTEKKKKNGIIAEGVVRPVIDKGLGFYGDVVGDSKFDENILPQETSQLDQIRASNQTIGEQAVNSIVGGIASGVLTAVEQLSYLGDLENNINRLVGLEYAEDNAISKFTKNAKEGLEQVMPIYRYDKEKVFDWSDSGFYFSSLKGILDSAVGFAVPGMAASKAIGAVQTGIRTAKYLEMIKGSKQVQQMVNAGLSGYITNFAEGKTMAIEQFENSMKDMEQKLFEDNFNKLIEENAGKEIPRSELHSQAVDLTMQQLDNGKREDFRTIAGDEGNKFMLRNKAFAITDAIGLHGIHKGVRATRALLKDPNFSAAAKRLTKISADNLLIQAGKEGAEEIGQNILQLEGEYQSALRADLEVDSPENLAMRIYEFGTSDQALLEGMMGLFGGGPQRILTEGISGNLSMGARAEKQKRYQEQQEVIKRTNEFVNKKLAYYSQGQALRAESLRTGQDNLEEIVKKFEFVNIATENFVRGTTEQLERQLKDIEKGVSQEERIANGWDEDYQQQATEQLELLRSMEKQYNRMSRYENQADVFLNRQNRRVLQEDKERLRTIIEDVDTEIELQGEDVDQETLKTKEVYENMMSAVNDRMEILDKSYKDLTSAETQDQVRSEKKELQKKAKENLKKAQAEQVKKSQEAKKKARQEARETKRKNQPQTETTTEEQTTETEQQPQAQETTEQETLTPERRAEVEKATNEFNNQAEELLTDIEKELDDIADQILVGDERLSPAQERLGKLENMLNNLQNIKGREVTFDDLIGTLLEQKGRERIAPLFGVIENVYKSYNPTHVSVNTLEEYLTVTDDEKKEEEIDKKAARQRAKEQYNALTEEEIQKELKALEESLRLDNQPSGDGTVEYLKVRSGAGILAYLSRKFQQMFHNGNVSRSEYQNVLNDEMQDKTILDPKKFKKGTKVTLVVEDNDDAQVYVTGTKTKQRTTWGAKKAAFDSGDRDAQQRDEWFAQNVPIAVYSDGKKIGYLHETEWINEDNVVPENVKEDKERNIKIRRHIVGKGEFETTIANKTNGYLFRSSEGPITTAEALPDESLDILVVSEGDLKSSRTKTFEGDLLNKPESLKEGVAYIILPVSETEQIAIPLMNKKLSENQKAVDTIMKAIDIFINEDKSEEAERIVREIRDQTGINISTNTGISDFIQQFVYSYSTGKKSLEEYLTDNTTSEQSNDVFLSIKQRENNDFYLEVSRGLGVGHKFLSKSVWKGMSSQERAFVMKSIREKLENMYGHTSLDRLDGNKNIVYINEQGAVEPVSYKNHIRESTKSAFLAQNIAQEGEEANYVYTLQPVITMDFTSIEGVNSQQQERTAQQTQRNFESLDEAVKYLSEDTKEDPSTKIKNFYRYVVSTYPELNLGNDIRYQDQTLIMYNKDGEIAIKIRAEIVQSEETGTRVIVNANEVKKAFPSKPETKKRETSQVSKTQKQLEQDIKNIEDEIKNLRGEDGSVSKKDMPKFKSLRNQLSIARRKAQRGNTTQVTILKKFEKGADIKTSDPIILQRKDKTEAADIIEKVIQSSKTAEEANQKVRALGYTFDLNIGHLFALYLKDRFDPTVPKVGNNKDSFQSWIQGKADSTNITKKETAPKPKPKYGEMKSGIDPTKIDSMDDPIQNEKSVQLESQQVIELTDVSEFTINEDGTTTGVIISELGEVKQRQLVSLLRAEAINRIFSGEVVKRRDAFKDRKAEFEADLKTTKKNLKLAQEAGQTEDAEMFERVVIELEKVLNNWTKLTKMAIQQIERVDNVRVIELEDDSETTVESRESENETANWSDNSAFTTNPVNNLAPELKRFLSGMHRYKDSPTGPVIDTNYLGLPKYMEFQETYNYIQRITPNLRPSYDEIVQAIKDNVDDLSPHTYFLKEVLEKLENSSQQIKNQFVSGMTNHNIEMRFIMFKRNENGSYSLTDYESNRNAITRVIQQDWFTKLATRSSIGNIEGEYIIDPQVKETLLQQYDRWVESGNYTLDDLSEWLSHLGIDLSDATMQELADGKIKYKGQASSLQKHLQFGLFGKLADNLRTRGNDTLSNNPLLNQTVVNVLASREAIYNLYGFSNSHRSGNKTIYSYGQNKYLVNRVRELKRFVEGNNSLLTAMKHLDFNGESAWLDALMQNGGDNAFAKNLNHWIVSLEALKKDGSKSKDNSELHKLSEDAIEVVKIGMLQASHTDVANEKNRIIKVLFPTTSDKTTVMGLRVVAADIVLDNKGNLAEESIDSLVDNIILPELARIQAFQDKKEKGKIPNIDGYDKGASQFLQLSEVNNIEGLFIEDGDGNRILSPDATSSEMRTKMKEVVRNYMDSLVNEKLVFWAENGIGEDGQFLDSKYLAGNTVEKTQDNKKNPLRAVDNDSKVRGAATDMVFQYLIANSEVSKLFTGDPALYYKQAAENRNRSRNSQEYNWVADQEETAINIGKRLAADIAPGTELAGAYENNYTQAFIADPQFKSLAELQLTELLDGKTERDRVAGLLKQVEEGKITKRAMLDQIKGLNSAPYYSYDAADAQEYTTWQEHLYVMKQLGELSDEKYTEIHFKLSQGKNISKEDLGTVMQPMKPVYVGTKIENGVERRVYIKSSSFPLLPQLTKSTELENLRVAMENNNISRAAYGTAVKVGNVLKENQTNIFDDQGKILPADQISFENSKLSLNRGGFRIQQKVPYDPLKGTINKVTQASKNLLINMLDVEGFSVPWINNGDPINGEKLQKEYHRVYNKLHRLKRDELLEEIDYNKETGSFDIEKVRTILLKEATERGYSISDTELLQLDKSLQFLSFSPSANKFEALLNSIVNNRVIKLVMPGKSFVLGSEAGFKQYKGDISSIEGIVYTSRWEGELKPAREGKNGERLPAQALVPWKYRDKAGNIINIAEFVKEVDGKTVIDNDKLPEELRYMFGMRIPNQGPNSQSWIEIVGFLPEASGDLLIATGDYVVQMGSDFDVDKLYTYMYNTYLDKTGKLKKQEKEQGKTTAEALQNKIIDVHIAIHRNNDPVVQSQIATPLGFWKLKDIAKDVVDLKKERRDSEESLSTERRWARSDPNGYEVSSQGDKRFSAFNATLASGETIEKAYQRLKGSGKGKPAVNPNFDYWGTYLRLWEQWADENPALIEELAEISKDKVLTDKFANTENNQARALSVILDKRQSVQKSKRMFTHLSDGYQRMKFKNAAAGKSGVGVFSLDSMFNAVVQGKGLTFTVPNPDRGEGQPSRIPLQLTIGRKKDGSPKTSDGDLSGIYDLEGIEYKSDIIAGYQSGAVDNEKEQILDKLNINNHTFKVIKILNQLGFAEEVPLFIAQDIVIDYVKELERLGSVLNGYTPERSLKAFNNVMNMPKYSGQDANEKLAGEDATVENLKKYIQQGPKATNYVAAQRAILTKFRTLDEYGLKIQTLQSTINPDSAGLGKSVLESQLKEDQIYKLIGSEIRNADKLIGQIVPIGNEEIADYEASGFVIRRTPERTYAIKPETINGFAVVYGLFTNNDLWNQLFNYNNENVGSLFSKIESIIGGENNDLIRSKAEKRYEVWKDMKSFIFSDDNLGLHDTTITEERQRLLYDQYETVVDDQGKESRVRTSESLASFLQSIKNTPFGRNNPLISKLTPEPQSNGTPSLIKYNASAGENADESSIYAAFLDAFTRVNSQGVSPVIGQFQGEEYTLSDIAQDLVLYSYITGGVQEAIQFVKFIPTGYLATIPFMEMLSDEEFATADLKHEKLDKPLQEYYNTPAFLEQYIQHNPDKVPRIDEKKHMTAQDTKNKKNATSFKLTKEGLEAVGKNIVEDSLTHPPYVAMRAGFSTSGLKLYKLDTSNYTYKQIDTLGSFGVTEYNKNTPNQRTLIRANRSSIPNEQYPRNNDPNRTVREEVLEETTEKQEESNIITDLSKGKIKSGTTFDNGKEKLSEIFNGIMLTSANPFHAAIANELLNNIEMYPETLALVFEDSTNEANLGKYIYNKHELHLATNTNKGRSVNQIEQALIHEAIHGITGYKAQLWELKNNQTDLSATERDRRIKVLEKHTTLSQKDIKVLNSIKVLMNVAKSKVENNPELKQAYDSFIKSKQAGNAKQFNQFYGLTSLPEFISEALTNKDFQEFLNSVPANTKNKTMLQSLLDKITELLRSIFDIEQGSVFESALYDIFELIDRSEVIKRGEYTVQETTDITARTGEPGAAQADHKNKIIKINSELLREKYDQKAWTNPRKQTDGTFPTALDSNIFTTFDNWRRFVIEHEYQHSIVKRKEGETMGQYEDRVNQAALKELDLLSEKKESKKTEEIFKQFGTYYKFLFDEKGKISGGFFSQGNLTNWKPMKAKTLLSKYDELKAEKEGALKPKKVNPETAKESMQMTLPDGCVITFNDQQHSAITNLEEWTNSDEQFFVLSGFAGTGKTTIIKKALDTFFRGKSVVVSAPTHKAKKVISKTTDQDGKTIHALLGLKPFMNPQELNPENREFARDPKARPQIMNYEIIIIDEASMLNKTLFQMILDDAAKYGKRVVFMGDSAQIPPIGEKLSEVFTHSKIDRRSHLDKVERQADGNPLFKVYDAIRNNINSATDQFSHKTEINDRGEGIQFITEEGEFREQVIEMFTSEEYRSNPDKAKLIAYTNKRVSWWNRIIRQAMFGDNTEFLEKGDVVTGYESVFVNQEQLVLENSVDYIVQSRSDLTTNSDGLQGFHVKLNSVDDTSSTDIFIVYDDQKNREKYKNDLERFKQNALQGVGSWRSYYAYKEKNILFGNDIGEGKNKISKQLDYGYAVTSHKSQGSTYETVFVDENNLDTRRWSKQRDHIDRVKRKLVPLTEEDVNTERNKLKYVALSRPTKNAVVYSRKATATRNTAVDSEVSLPFTPDQPPPTVWTDGESNDQTILSLLESNTPVARPQDFVSDDVLDAFMKQCKG